MTAYAITIADLTASHVADLRKVRDNPGHHMPPQRRGLLKRLELIVQTSGRRAARASLARPAPRQHALTTSGLDVVSNAPPDPVKPPVVPRDVNGTTYVGELPIKLGRRCS